MHFPRLPRSFLVAAFLAPAFAFAAPTLPGIGAAMKQKVDEKEIAGAVTVVLAKDKVLHLESTGYADLAAKKPITPDTLFWIASMSKPVTEIGRAHV